MVGCYVKKMSIYYTEKVDGVEKKSFDKIILDKSLNFNLYDTTFYFA